MLETEPAAPEQMDEDSPDDEQEAPPTDGPSDDNALNDEQEDSNATAHKESSVPIGKGNNPFELLIFFRS